MRNPWLLTFFVAVGIAGPVCGQDPVDVQMQSVLANAKSRVLLNREASVRELIALRESISEGLLDIVTAANAGTANPGSKASALFLMGELGSVACKTILIQERNWRWKPDLNEVLQVNAEGRRKFSLLGTSPALSALNRASFPEANFAFLTGRDERSLSAYPSLQKALTGLRSSERPVRRTAEDVILRWYEIVCRSMRSVLKPSRADLYSNDIKATAAYILGEYRTHSGQMLLWNIDLKDENSVCARYTKTIDVRTSETAYPCVVALLKLGPRADVDMCLGRIATMPALSQETRNRIARVVVAIDPVKAREMYDSKIAVLDPGDNWVGTPEDRQSRLRLLRTVEPIIQDTP